jgi:integrase
LRQGEQIGIKPEDIDWENGILYVKRAITYDESGNIVEGQTNNKYSRRSIKLLPIMIEALNEQKKVYDLYKGKYFFCNKIGERINKSALRQNFWIPALKKAGITLRAIKHTRHTFATIALSCGENPLWVAKVMGHRNTDMVIRVYSEYVEDINGAKDGLSLNKILQGDNGNYG